jgi:hypothetical protein
MIYQFLIVGQNAHVKVDLLTDLPFQIGLSAEEPEKNSKNIKRVSLDQGEERFDQQIRVDKGPVQIDHERNLRLSPVDLR